MAEKKDVVEEVVVEKVREIFNKGYNRQVILYGPPGTSKTYYAKKIAAELLGIKNEEVLENDERYCFLQFHPSYTYEDFVRGITVKTVYESNGEVQSESPKVESNGEVQSEPPKVESNGEGQSESPKVGSNSEDQSESLKVKSNGKGQSNKINGITYEVEDKVFGKFAKKAADDKKNKYVIIIDEINRAPLAAVLGELIYGLEYREKRFSTSYSLKEQEKWKESNPDEMYIPDNLYIIGTMNTADRSIGSIDYAVRRRFAFVQLPAKPEIAFGTWFEEGSHCKVSESKSDRGKGKNDGTQPEQADVNGTSQNSQVKITVNGNDVTIESNTNLKVKEDLFKSIVKLWYNVDKIFDECIGNSIEKDDIKIGHTYFILKDNIMSNSSSTEDTIKDPTGEEKLTDKAKEYMQYVLEYQIKPILYEYVKDELLTYEAKEKIDNLSL